MASNQGPNAPVDPNDLPPPYSSVVGNPQYGFVDPSASTQTPSPAVGAYPHPQPQPKSYTAPGVYPHPPANTPLQAGNYPVPPSGVPVVIGLPPEVASQPTTVTCYNCGKVVTTRVVYTTAWHTHLLAGSICVITMMCSLCCLGLVPYCLDTFKDAEHYCPECNSFINKNRKC